MKNRIIRFLLFILITVVVSSCITARKTNYLQKPGNEIPSYSHSDTYSEYKIKSGDKLYIRIYSTHEETNKIFNRNLSQGGGAAGGEGNGSSADLSFFTVQEDGTIYFPTAGDILVRDLTIREAGLAVENSLGKLFQINSVDLKLAGRYFSVISQSRAGQFFMQREKITIFQAMAMTGDLGQYSDRSKIRIIRETSQGTIIKIFDLRSKDIINSEFYYIEPNDVIYIQDMDEQFYSITNMASLLSTIISSMSFIAFMVKLFTPASS